MNTLLDLDAYFERIRWGGEARPTLGTLTEILRAHMSTIPFENLDVLLRRRVRLDIEGLQTKLVASRRGGYCFEHATLLAAVLERLGFCPVRHSARVTLLAPRNAAPRTHMFLTVKVADGTFVIDPGFGALASRIPVPLEDGGEARTDQEMHWMVRDGDCWVLRAQTGDKIVDAWVSTLEEERPVDFEVANHFTSTHPSSPFVNRMMLHAFIPGGRIGVMNRDVTLFCADPSQPAQLTDRLALRKLLVEHFGFDLPEAEALRVPSIPEWE